MEVTGAAGGPYTVTFGGSLGGDDLTQMTTMTTGLKVSSGSKTATVSTPVDGGAFESCIAVEGDECKEGTPGPKPGQFNARAASIREDTSGAIYTVENETSNGNHRVQKFTPTGSPPYLEASLFGYNEQQDLAVHANGGTFTIDAIEIDGTTGKAKWSNEPQATLLSTTTGAFVTGQPFSVPSENSFITAIEGNTLKLSAPTGSSCNTSCTVTSNALESTGELEATASAGEVETALNALPAINADGGSVTVTGGPGNASGSSPYHILFAGGALAGADIPSLIVSEGSIPLSGGSGPDADSLKVTTVGEGGPQGTGHKDDPLGLALMPNGDIMIAKEYPPGASECEGGTRSPHETRLQRVNAAGNATVEVSLPCAVDVSRQTAQQAVLGSGDGVRVDPNTGLVYLSAGRAYVFGDAGNGARTRPESRLGSRAEWCDDFGHSKSEQPDRTDGAVPR